jgi:hypothetical protein
MAAQARIVPNNPEDGMPVLPNARHEAFAQAVAKGKSATEAYTSAGYKGDRGAASRLSANINVQRRVTELQAMTAEKVAIDQAWVMSKLVDVANQNDNLNAKNKALELIGKELGMFVERSENVNLNYDISDEPAGEDDWTAEYARPN